MKLVVISDTHGLPIWDDLPLGDVLIHCGDFSNVGGYEEVKSFMEWMVTQPHPHKLIVPGNHEVSMCPLKHGNNKVINLVKSYFPKVKCLVDQEVLIGGLKFYGTPWCGGDKRIMSRWGFYMEHDTDRRAAFANIPHDTDVLITHTPPFGILDDGLGCVELANVVREVVRPKVHVFGHIHERNGHVNMGRVNYYNCSNMGHSHTALGYPPRVIDIYI